jgi:hypothetical protein
MNCCQGEPNLFDALSDPIIRAVMAADRVDAVALASSLRETAVKVASHDADATDIERSH